MAPSTRDWTLPSSVPPDGFQTPAAASAPLPSAQGGGPSVDGVTRGKCVVILETDAAHTTLCCARVGSSGRLACVAPAATCTIESHRDKRVKRDTVPLRGGIYVRSPARGMNVYTDLVGPLRILEHHRDAVMKCEEKTPTDYLTLFNDWDQHVDSENAAQFRTAKKAAKALQTPGKPFVSTALELSTILGKPSVALADDLQLGLEKKGSQVSE